MFDAPSETIKLLKHRPSIAYLLLLIVSLFAWCLHDSSRIMVVIKLFVWITLATTLFPHWLLKLSFRQIFWICISLFLGNYFWFADTLNVPAISIFSAQFVNAACLSLIVLIALQWVSWRSAKFDWLLFSIGLLLILSGVSWQTNQHKLIFAGLVLCFVAILFVMRLFPRFRLHQANSESKKQASPQNLWVFSGVHWIMFFIFISLSLVFSKSIEFADQRFDEMLTDFLLDRQDAWSGFSGQTVLGSAQNINLSEEIALSVRSEKAIDYWRGTILSYYQGGRWSPQEILHLPPEAQTNANLEQEYQLYENTQSQGTVIVEMYRDYQGILFLPYQSQSLILKDTTDIYQNQYQLFRHEAKGALQNYSLSLDLAPVWKNQIPAQWDQNILKENLQIDANVQKQLKPLALVLTQDLKDPIQKARVLENWFHQEFQYSLKTTPTQFGQDPTVDFVLNRKAAYCSWFASGMTLMLRSIGIPAHLVSGWRSMEWNPWVQKWIIKEKQAHDWVEVLDSEHNQWVRFDPTPTAQLNQLIQETPWPITWLKNIELVWHDLRQNMIDMNLKNLLQILKNILLAMILHPVFLALIVCFVAFKTIKRIKKSAVQSHPVEQEPDLEYSLMDLDLRRDWQRLTDYLAQKQLELPVHQPLETWLIQNNHRFEAEEYRLLMRFIELFQAIRFGVTADPPVQELSDLLQELENSTRSQAPNTIQ